MEVLAQISCFGEVVEDESNIRLNVGVDRNAQRPTVGEGARVKVAGAGWWEGELREGEDNG